MTNESIFNFLNEDIIFKDVHRKTLELEKNIYNKQLETALYNSRYIIEQFVRIIIVEDRQDKKLSKELLSKKKNVPLRDKLYRCSVNKYITSNFYHRLDKFVENYGNEGAHDNPTIFNCEDMKSAHKLIFDFSVCVYKRFDKKFKKEYSFDLSYLDENSTFTKKEISQMINDIKPDEVSSDEIMKKAKEEFISKNQLDSILEKYNQKIDLQLQLNKKNYVSKDNLNSILNNFDNSTKKSILEEVEKSQKQQYDDIMDIFKEYEGHDITISQINELIENNNETIKNDILNSIKDVAGELIKSHLGNIISEIQSVPIVEEGTVIEAPNYEIVESEDSFEIKEIEEILGIPDECPKCGAKLKKGLTKCSNCDYDLFDDLNKRCPKCGKRIPLGSKFCIRCGNDLEKYKCNKCGYENKKGTKFCIKCGNAL